MPDHRSKSFVPDRKKGAGSLESLPSLKFLFAYSEKDYLKIYQIHRDQQLLVEFLKKVEIDFLILDYDFNLLRASSMRS